jgi:hypothetical protein
MHYCPPKYFAKATRKKKMISVFNKIPTEQALYFSIHPPFKSLSTIVRKSLIASHKKKGMFRDGQREPNKFTPIKP